jgi:hypothetical protein
MTRTKKKSSSPDAAKPSVVDSAWTAFLEKSTVEDIDELRKRGWRSAYELSEVANGSREALARRLSADSGFERKNFRVHRSGQIREMIFFRPKIKG